MITVKSKHGQIPTNKIKMYKNGILVDIEKVYQYDPAREAAAAGTGAQVVFPVHAYALDLQTNFDQNPAKKKIAGLQYAQSLIDTNAVGFAGIEVMVKPVPENAGWKLTSDTGCDLGEHEGKVYYGTGVAVVYPADLPDEGEKVHRITAVPAAGSVAQPQTFWFTQVRRPAGSATYLAKWDFEDTLLSENGNFRLSNINESSPEVNPEAKFVQGSLPDKTAINSQYIEAADTAGLEASTYSVDVSELLPERWWEVGLAVSAVVKQTANETGFIKVGLVDMPQMHDYHNGHHFAIATSYTQPSAQLWQGVPNPHNDEIKPTERAYEWKHIAISLEPVDFMNDPNVVITPADANFTDPKDDPTYHGANVTYTDPYIHERVDNALRLKQYSFNWNTYNIKDSNPDPAVRGRLDTDYAMYKMYIWQDGVRRGMRMSMFPIHQIEAFGQLGGGMFTVYLPSEAKYLTSTNSLEYCSLVLGPMTEGDILAEMGQYGIGISDSGETGSISQRAPYDARSPRYREKAEDPAVYDLTPTVIKPFIIDDRTIVVGGAYDEKWWETVIRAEFPYVEAAGNNYYNGYIHLWQYHFAMDFNMNDVMADYGPLHVDWWNDFENHVTIDGRTFTRRGVMSHTNGPLVFKDFKYPDKVKQMDIHEIHHFGYMTLDTPLADGETITINVGNKSTTLTYDRNTPSQAIKVNQSGYTSDTVTSKVACLGAWLGLDAQNDNYDARKYQPLDNPNFDRSFSLVPVGSTTPVYTGTMVLRDVTDLRVHALGPSSFYTHPVNGEYTYMMDFTDFGTEGDYQIYVNGVGYSWPFHIGNKAAGDIFYSNMRGLFHQRSGEDRIKKPYTNFEIPISRPEAYEGGYPSNHKAFETNLVDTAGVPFKDAVGSYFGAQSASATGRIMRHATGGWCDAADFDSRPLHMVVIRGLANTFLENPAKFYDGQLHIPDGGNGIPDILQEALWGLSYMYKAQREDGAVFSWVESDQHEKIHVEHTSDVKYYTSTYDCHSSLEYAFSAALVARGLLLVDHQYAQEVGRSLLDSAARAFKFGCNPDNLAYYTFDRAKSGGMETFTYQEEWYEIEGPAYRVFPAAAELYAQTRDPFYLEHINDTTYWDFAERAKHDYNGHVRWFVWGLHFDLKEEFPDYESFLRRCILHWAKKWGEMQDRWAYPMAFFGPDQVPYDWGDPELGIYIKANADFMWNSNNWGMYGGTHHRGRAWIYAWYLTRDQQWKDRIAKLTAWHYGCNATGQTLVTSVGHNFPTVFLHGWSDDRKADNWWLMPEGLSYYGFGNPQNYMTPYGGLTAHGVWYMWKETRAVHGYNGADISLMPAGFRATTSLGNIRDQMGSRLPKYRARTEKLTDQNPAMGEYTIHETMFEKIQFIGVLLEEGYVPAPEKAAIVSPTNKYDIEGWFALP